MDVKLSYVIGLLKQVAAMDNKLDRIDSAAERSIAERIAGDQTNEVKDLMQKYIDGEAFTYSTNETPKKNESRVVNYSDNSINKESSLYETFLKDAVRYQVKYDNNGNWVNSEFYDKNDKLVAQEEYIKNDDGTTSEIISTVGKDIKVSDEFKFNASGEPVGVVHKYGDGDMHCIYETLEGGYISYITDSSGKLDTHIALGNDYEEFGYNTIARVCYPIKDNYVITDKEIDEASKKALKEHLGLDVIVDKDLMEETNKAHLEEILTKLNKSNK